MCFPSTFLRPAGGEYPGHSCPASLHKWPIFLVTLKAGQSDQYLKPKNTTKIPPGALGNSKVTPQPELHLSSQAKTAPLNSGRNCTLRFRPRLHLSSQAKTEPFKSAQNCTFQVRPKLHLSSRARN